MPDSMTFSLFGGKGGIARRLSLALRGLGYECRAIDRESVELTGIHLGHVIYAAGVTGDFRTRPHDAMEAHVTRVARILHMGAFDSFLYLSSTRVYRLSGHGSEDLPLVANPEEAESLYDVSKLSGEVLCLTDRRPTVRVARLSNLAAISVGRPDLLSQIFAQARATGEVEFQSSLESERDFVACADAERVMIDIALRGRRRLYNVASGENVSNGVIADLLREQTGCKTRVRTGAPTFKYPCVDISRIAEEFNYEPTAPREVIRSAIAEAIRNAA